MQYPCSASTCDPALHSKPIMHISKAGNPSGDLESKMLCSVPLGQNIGEIMEGSQAERLIIVPCLSVEAGLEAV